MILLGDLCVPALLGSGSSVRLINRSVFRKLSKSHKISLAKTDLSCVSANAGKVNILGSFQYTMKISGFSWKESFFLSDQLVIPVIFGGNFLRLTGLVMDYRDRRFSFKFCPGTHLRYDFP